MTIHGTRTVGVVGLGKLGACVAAVLASQRNVDVVAHDINQRTLDKLAAGEPPVDEPRLGELVAATAGRSLFTTADIADVARDASMTFIVVPTPSQDNGRFASDYVVDAVLGLCRHITGPHTIVVVSTVMPGAIDGEIAAAAATCSRGRVSLVYSPEFIALGSVIRDLTRRAVILVGTHDDHAGDVVTGFLLSTLDPTAPPPRVHRMAPLEAEVSKLCLNVALSVKSAFPLEVSGVCEAIGADGPAVLECVGADPRIGPALLRPGASAGGPCLPRDLAAFDAVAAAAGRPALLANAADNVHRGQASLLLGQLLGEAAGIDTPVIGVLGAAYKPGTPVTDESVSVRLAAGAAGAGVSVVMHDPAADLSKLGVKVAASASEVIDQADVILVATAWPEYKTVDYRGKPVIDLWGEGPQPPNVHRFGKG